MEVYTVPRPTSTSRCSPPPRRRSTATSTTSKTIRPAVARPASRTTPSSSGGGGDTSAICGRAGDGEVVLVRRPLVFPSGFGSCGPADADARDLIARLFAKDPAACLGSPGGGGVGGRAWEAVRRCRRLVAHRPSLAAGLPHSPTGRLPCVGRGRRERKREEEERGREGRGIRG
uniref:Uncharacterized protein n=1 Tax=Oryza glumipatula TaxID=40148 RepID=A0A0E0B3R5_9ORYZ